MEQEVVISMLHALLPGCEGVYSDSFHELLQVQVMMLLHDSTFRCGRSEVISRWGHNVKAF